MDGRTPVKRGFSVSMLTDSMEPSERDVACPNQDVLQGGGPRARHEPVVVPVPCFVDRFWVCQIVDLRTDSFAGLLLVAWARLF